MRNCGVDKTPSVEWVGQREKERYIARDRERVTFVRFPGRSAGVNEERTETPDSGACYTPETPSVTHHGTHQVYQVSHFVILTENAKC